MSNLIARRRAQAGDGGFSLMELLVVIFLMSIVGSITSVGIINAMKGTRQTQTRVLNQTGLETQLQRMARDLRVADPIRAVSTSSVVFDIYRSNGCRRIEYRVNAGALEIRTQTWSAATGCSAYPAATTPTSDTGYKSVLTGITSATPFGFLDRAGTTLTTPTTATAKQVTITLTQSQPENRPALTMSASVYLRNAS